MLQVIKCPSCAAPLECDGDPIEKCDFCGSRIAVNQNNLFSENSFGFDGLLKNAHKLKEILRLARGGNKIEAIKIYRETFGTSLAEAKNAVDKLESGQSISFQNIQFQTGNSSQLNKIANLARNGNKIEAIKLYRETFEGVSLLEAKNAVERLERGQSINFQTFEPIKVNTEAAKTALKAVGIFSGSMILISGIITVLVIAVVGIVLWMTLSKIEKTTQITSSSPSTSKLIESTQSSFAHEVLRFGGEGTGAGKFTDNRVIAVDGEGKIYSADYQGGRVQVFEKDGKFLTQWFVKERDSVIYSLAASRKGTVFVTQPSGKIMAYEGSSGKLLNEAKLDISSALSTTLDGKVVAANRTDILVIDETLKPVSTYKNAAQNAGIQGGFNYLATNGLGEIFAINRFGKDVVKFSAEGKFLDRFKVKPISVRDFAIDPKGRIFIADSNEIFVYQPDGTLVDSFKPNQCFAITFNDEGELITASRPFVVKYTVNQ